MNSATYALIAISLGAVSGALSRYYLTIFFARWLGTTFPYGTFFINITGAFLMGFFITLTSKLAIFPQLNLLVAVGFLGSYTTFSTYALDTSNLLRSQKYLAAILYWCGSAILGFISIELGIFLAKILSTPLSRGSGLKRLKLLGLVDPTQYLGTTLLVSVKVPTYGCAASP